MSVINRIFIVIFFTFILIPLIQLELKIFPELVLNEKRIPIPRPVPYFKIHSIKSFKSSLDYFSKYIEDNFGFRNYFIYIHNRIKISLFQVSPSSQVVLGKKNWLYYDSINRGKIERTGHLAAVDKSIIESYNAEITNKLKENLITTEFSLPDYLGLTPLEESELIKIKNNIESLDKLLSKNNIKLLIVVAPNKHTIYPEFLPDWITSLKRGETRLDQVLNYMNKNSNFKISDYRKTFLKNKVSQKLFLQLDTHFNNEGNILFANEIINSLNHPLVSKFEQPDFILQEDKYPSVDLVDIAGIPSILREESNLLKLKNSSSTNCEPRENIVLRAKDVCTFVNNKFLPSVIVYGDSFGERFSVLLREKFRKYFFFSRTAPIQEKIIIQEKPDFVIIEFVERAISELSKLNIERR